MSRYATSMFCDDIRHEVNGKISFIGTFATSLFMPSVPAVLPKLCCIISLHTGLDDPLTSIKINGSLGEQTVFSMDLGEEEVKNMYAAAPPIDDRKGFVAQFMMVISPFNIESFGKLDIDVIADGTRVECAGLHISPPPAGMVLI